MIECIKKYKGSWAGVAFGTFKNKLWISLKCPLIGNLVILVSPLIQPGMLTWASLNATQPCCQHRASVASDANFLAGYYLNHGNKLLVEATICSKSLSCMCLHHADKKIQQAKFYPQKQRCLWLNKDKNTTVLKCFANSYVFNQIFPFKTDWKIGTRTSHLCSLIIWWHDSC